MNLSRIPTWVVIAVMVLASIVFALTGYQAVAVPSDDSITADRSVYALPVTAEDPVRLSIPSLSVVATIERVGINVKGNIAAPKSFATAGWYVNGPRPGEGGNAIIDGHVNNGLNLPGVFLKLADIKSGAGIIITDKGGTKMHFTVSEVREYDFTASTTDILMGDKDRPRLILITCDGTWLPDKKTYDKRLVVFADLTP